MKQRHFESVLQSACSNLDFSGRPNIELEQYSTSPHLATQVLYFIQEQYGDITNKLVGDFGCGCGVLTAGCGLLQADMVFSFDIDPRCLAITNEHCANIEEMCLWEGVRTDLSYVFPRTPMLDTVIMNPPFGTRKAGVDLAFLETALVMAKSVFSLHKSTTRRYIEKKCGEWGVNCELVATLNFDLPKTYKMHKKKSVDIEVDLWHCVAR